jgi:16S rRNA (guanine(966)-N(2))-methyltransferase RsmD
MRIISGRYRNKRISAPNNLPVRPTTDIAKEALFNILNNYIYFEDVSVLDLYAGTGNIGYEFASRGAKNIISVDANLKCFRFIKKTIEQLDFKNEMKAIMSPAISFTSKTHQKFDIIFADPPYDYEEYVKLINSIFERELLNEGGMFVLEHSLEVDFTDHPHVKEERKYGRVHFTIFTAEKQKE